MKTYPSRCVNTVSEGMNCFGSVGRMICFLISIPLPGVNVGRELILGEILATESGFTRCSIGGTVAMAELPGTYGIGFCIGDGVMGAVVGWLMDILFNDGC